MSLSPFKSKQSENAAQKPLRILQIGGGNFLRAFLGWMVETANREAAFDGDILIVKPTRRGSYDALRAQRGGYHVWVRGISKGMAVSELLPVQCVRDIINPYTDWDAFLQSARIKTLRFVVSNTTESGIRYEPLNRPEQQAPDNFPAKLTWWLYHRFQHFRADKSAGCVILPCELISQNGEALKDCVTQYARSWDLGEDFSHWLTTANNFCNTLVDCIVSGYPSADEAERLHREIGFADQLLVTSEPYRSWIVETRDFQESCLPQTRTPLGIHFVSDLQPYREMKVRILNGAHTLMVPTGYLAGLKTVQQCMEDKQMKVFVDGLMDEICSVVPLPASEVQVFRAQTLERFRNPFLHHELLSISLNSIDKFKTRVLPTLVDYVDKQGVLPDHIVFAFGALLIFYKGISTSGPIPLSDSTNIIETFRKVWETSDGSREAVTSICDSLLRNKDFWGRDLTHIPGLKDRVSRVVYHLESEGMREAMRKQIPR